MDASRKKIILIAIASSAGFLLLLALGWFLYFNAQFSVYQDDQYKFSIKYPRTWEVVTHPKATVAVVFRRPKVTALDTMQENFSVIVQPLPDGIFTMEAFSATIKDQMTGVFGKSINIVENKPLHWGWREGRQMAIEAPKPDHLKMVNAWVLRSTQAVILTFLGDMKEYGSVDFLADDFKEGQADQLVMAIERSAQARGEVLPGGGNAVDRLNEFINDPDSWKILGEQEPKKPLSPEEIRNRLEAEYPQETPKRHKYSKDSLIVNEMIRSLQLQ